jgi:hypothetical protein
LEATNRFIVKKENLWTIDPDKDYRLDAKDKSVLQSWLAARYRRHAFPDRLMEILGNGKFWKVLAKKPLPRQWN